MRYLILVSAVLMQVCLGATYSWSVYVQPLREMTGLAQGPVQVPFTLFYFVFPLAMMIAGGWLPRIGHVSRVYGWLFTANIPAALAPIAAGIIFDITGNFFPALAGLSILLALTVLLIRKKSAVINDRVSPV